MRKKILILAVTTMPSGYCVAGIDTQSKTWIRPIRKRTNSEPCLSVRDVIKHQSGRYIDLLNVYEMSFAQPAPQPPHIEDWEVAWQENAATDIKLVDHIGRGNIENTLSKYIETPKNIRVADYLMERKRSLCIIKPDKIVNVKSVFENGRMKSRIQFYWGGFLNESILDRSPSCTCIRWLKYIKGKSDSKLLADLSSKTVFLAIGLSRLFRGNYWPLVVGVFPTDGSMHLEDLY